MTTRVIQPMFDPSPRVRPTRVAKSRNRVSRQLFGTADHEETRKFIEAEWRKDQRVASDTWDFDFVKGQPKLESAKRYEWTKVSLTFAPRRPRKPEPEPDITELYAAPSPIVPESQLEQDQDQDLSNGDDKLKKKEDGDDDDTLKSKQTKITDFMVIRKRNSESISTKNATESVIPSKISKYNC